MTEIHLPHIHCVPWSVGILGIGLELHVPWNGGSCGGISLKITFENISSISLSCKLVLVQYRDTSTFYSIGNEP